MLRCKLGLTLLTFFALAVGFGMTQPAKDKKDAKDPPSIEKYSEPDTFKDDLKTVRERGLKGEGADLLQYFKDRTLKAPDPKVIAALVRELGDEDFQTREKAFDALGKLGASALAGLKDAENDPDLEIKKRAGDLKARIDTKAEPMLQGAAARVIAKLKPEGSADVLLAFLPFASDSLVVDEICKTLGAVAVQNGKVEPVIVKSLEDPIAVKRAAAGEAIARANVKEELAHVKKLLTDKDINVRLRLCMAMLPLQDKDILPVMVDLLADLTPNQLWPIEEALIRLAGDKAPTVSLGNDPVARKACRDAWSKWLTANEKTIDMTKLTEDTAFLGYTLVVQYNNRIGVGGGNMGEIYELSKEKTVRWKFTMPQGYPVDAQMIGSTRVIVAEWQGGRVTERDVKTGDVKWEYVCGGNPFTVQRLPNGNTFIAMQGRLIEVDRNKNVVWSYQRPNNDIVRARRLPNGEVCFITNLGIQATFTRMEPRTQKVLKSFNVTAVQVIFGSMEVLPNGNILVPHYQQQRVTEYNQDGGQVKNFNQQWPNSVVRLPNGNTLVASQNTRQVVEFNAAGDRIDTYQTDGMVFVARRR